MVNKIIRHKSNIVCCTIILALLSLSILFYSGTKEGYFNIFLLASIIAPMIIISIPKNTLAVDISFGAIMVLLILLYGKGFWVYRDGFMSFTDIQRLPKEVVGWFSFENPLRLNLLLFCSTTSILLSTTIRLIVTKLKRVKVL
ncbi:hypothetical protein [Desnuesiella massiliensis]|uniref:hypothetical protein n=1 Tax=Desnuesiella massiliensis TaxID=1650662 RepID=UPI0006E21B2B|nr:hypothetical protein [Desnuesiella massiliensis]